MSDWMCMISDFAIATLPWFLGLYLNYWLAIATTYCFFLKQTTEGRDSPHGNILNFSKEVFGTGLHQWSCWGRSWGLAFHSPNDLWRTWDARNGIIFRNERHTARNVILMFPGVKNHSARTSIWKLCNCFGLRTFWKERN